MPLWRARLARRRAANLMRHPPCSWLSLMAYRAPPAPPAPPAATPWRSTKFRRRWAASPLLLAVACAAPLLSGCSFLFVDGPPPHHRSLAYFDCTSSRLAPVTDLVLGGLEGIGVAAEVAGQQRSSDSSVIAPAAVAAAFVASGIVGFMRVSSCNEAKSLLIGRTLESPPRAPQPLYQRPADPWLTPPPSLGGGWSAPPAPAQSPPAPAAPAPTSPPAAPAPTSAPAAPAP